MLTLLSSFCHDPSVRSASRPVTARTLHLVAGLRGGRSMEKPSWSRPARSASQTFSTCCVELVRVTARCRRPLPWHWTWPPAPKMISAQYEVEQLRDSQAGLESEHQQGRSRLPSHRCMSGASMSAAALGVEEAHRGLVEVLGGYGQHVLDHAGVLGMSQGGIAQQGPDSGHTKVAGAGVVAPVGLEMVQEGRDRLLAEVGPVQAGKGLARPVLMKHGSSRSMSR